MKKAARSYLALGDSYTIGEGVPLCESFPYQLVHLMRRAGHVFQAPEIVAKTGWTSSELQTAIGQTPLQPPYDLVSLLIGVNNQYRGERLEQYAREFEQLLELAIGFAGNKASAVLVLSIPDWGVTPFAGSDKHGRNSKQISDEIDSYNSRNKAITAWYEGVRYVDITTSTRAAATDISLLVADQLHPSGKEYQKWAEKIKRLLENE
jgi:lysophospholipase L1-like esterase